MGLREIFTGSEIDRYEREAKKEDAFQNRLTDSLKLFRRQGRQLLAKGEMAKLRERYVKSAVDPALDEEGREWEVFGRVDEELRTLIAEYDVDLDGGLYADI